MTEQEIKYNAFVKDDAANNRGRLVNCCDELNYFLENPYANKIVVKRNLNEILTYATTFSDYYKAYADFKKLQDFPIMSKQDLKDHWDEIAVKNIENLPDSVTKYTSGSTGTPFKMVLDRYKHCRWIAGNKVFRAKVGVPSHTKTVFINDTVEDKNIPMERQDRDNVYYRSSRYLDDDSLRELISYLKDNDVHTMTAMASIWEKMANLISDGGLPTWGGNMTAVFSVSEALKSRTRNIISEYFSCPMYVLYANEENGVLAVEDGTDKGCRANNVDFYFEVLSMDSNEPVRDGEIGRLVITDFFNKAFPVIRYENGDLVSVKHYDDGTMYITEILGRQVDTLYTTDGRMVHYFDGISFLEKYMDIRQFQLVQYDFHHFKWILNTKNHGYENEIIETSKELFGADSEWEFEYVDEIPKLRSGKVRMTLNLMDSRD